MREGFNYPPLLLVLNFILGIVLGDRFDFFFFGVEIFLFCGGLIILILLLFKRFGSISKYVEFGVFSLFFVFLGFSSFSLTAIKNSENFFEGQLNQESNISVLEISETLKGNRSFNRFVAEVIQVNGKKAEGRIVLNVREDTIGSIGIGDRILSDSDFNLVQDPRNPGEFNYRKYLSNQQIYHQVFQESDEFLKIAETSESFVIKLQKFRSDLIQKLSHAGIKNDELAVISALLLGDKNFLSSELRQSYIDAGAIHILAISGLHVGIIFLMFSFLLKPLKAFKHGKLVSQIIIVVGLWLFAIIAGLSPSVVRAVTMFSFISVGLFLNRRNSVYHSLIASAFVLLLIHPRFLFEVGFQLSYTAVFSIVWIQPKLQKLWKPKFKLLDYTWKLFTVSAAAQLGVLPLSLFYFHQFPALFFLSNVVIIPVLGMLLGAGLFVLLLVEFGIYSEFIIELYSTVIGLLNDFISFIAGFESFVIQNIYWSTGLLISGYLLIFFFFKYVENRSRTRFAMTTISIIVFYGIMFKEVYLQKNQKELIVFHKGRSTIIGEVNRQKLRLFGVSESEQLGFINNLMAAKGIKEVVYNSELPNILFDDEVPIVLIDSLGLYNYTSVESPVLLLTNSPKINLDRMIVYLNPSVIISDGSNYRSYVKRWEWSALKTKTPFYDTSQKGAYIFK